MRVVDSCQKAIDKLRGLIFAVVSEVYPRYREHIHHVIKIVGAEFELIYMATMWWC